MITKSFRLEDLERVNICIGYVGENEHTQVRIDCASAFEEYPGATPALAVKPPRGGIYPAVIETEGNIVVWTVTNSDLLFKGDGEIQFSFSLGDVIKKTAVGKFTVKRSIITSANVPDPVAEWLVRATAAAAAAEAAAQHQPMIGLDGYWYKWDSEAEEYVNTGTKAQGPQGEPGAPGDPTQLIDDTTPAANKVFSSSKVDTELGGVKSAIQELPSIDESTKTGVDLDVTDQSGNVIVRFHDGHIKTKEFDSTKIKVNSALSDSSADFDFSDTNGNVLLRLENGHVKTKNFDSSTAFSGGTMIQPTAGDMSSIIESALTNSKYVKLAPGTFNINSTVTVPQGSTIEGCGATTVIQSGVSNGAVFSLTTDCEIANLTIKGTGTSSAPSDIGTEHGIYIMQYDSRNRISNVDFENLKGHGIYTISTYHSGNVHDTNIIDKCRFNYCGSGVYITTRAEGNVISNSNMHYCKIGIHCIGGNNRIIGNLIRGCRTGIDMTSSTTTDNDGHSIFCNNDIIHNTVAISATKIENGSIFNGCMIFYGNITLSECTAMIFNACEIGAGVSLNSSSGNGNRLSNIMFLLDSAPTISGFALNDCTLKDGTAVSA